jgi:hypothetical protein
MRVIAITILLFWSGPTFAAGFTFGGGHEYPYPNEPQYQYPRTDGKDMKCPKGQMPYQGKCRPVRWMR